VKLILIIQNKVVYRIVLVIGIRIEICMVNILLKKGILRTVSNVDEPTQDYRLVTSLQLLMKHNFFDGNYLFKINTIMPYIHYLLHKYNVRIIRSHNS